ncbi:hypothetical protein [Nitrosomonas supralitoralis]|uniref:Uncharacterized protein n=1 Tax=Nitrosomonas supralitoralis TaxID=2116706 RepID=A0A2P7NR88_9PROT|nr:hypothetical protein [Nitrosomonas supralitoralis]PSJ15970.1 hypothetical protein C7H79_16125 [Nitrosomonas supralitoralis]
MTDSNALNLNAQAGCWRVLESCGSQMLSGYRSQRCWEHKTANVMKNCSQLAAQRQGSTTQHLAGSKHEKSVSSI